jgi:hypothetical protein
LLLVITERRSYEVTLSGYSAASAFVSSGLHPGDKVITAGVNKLRDGEKLFRGASHERSDKKQRFNLSAWALEHQQLVSMFMMLILVAGILCYQKLPRNEDPAFTIKTAVVSAQWPGANIEDTTRLVTDVLEKKLQETPWLDYIESETRAGSSVIYVNLRDDTPPQNVQGIWYQVRKKMQDIATSLPEGRKGLL